MGRVYLAQDAAGQRVALLWCRGHIALSDGGAALGFLERARSLLAEIDARPESELGRAFRRLERAVQAQVAGGPLFRGQLAEDLPEGLRRAVEGNEQRAAGTGT